ncbi:MAG: hypothetical protein RJA70_4392 [Pseudomonadota bacterium]|jgi:hypothetical protein
MRLIQRREDVTGSNFQPRAIRNLLLVDVGQQTVGLPAEAIIEFTDDLDEEVPLVNLAEVLGLDPRLTDGRKARFQVTGGVLMLNIGSRYRMHDILLQELLFPPAFIRELMTSAVNFVFNHAGRIALHLDVEHLRLPRSTG